MLFNGGILTPASLVARYQVLANTVQSAIVGESAHWGDMHYPTAPLTPANWVTEHDWILNTYLPQRTGIVLAEFKKYGLYPSVDAPTFSQFGGNFAGGFKLSIGNSNSGGAVYYTLDGSDPRLIGGALNTAAKVYSSPIELSGNVTVQARSAAPAASGAPLVEAPFSQSSVGAVRGDFNRDGNRTAADLVPMMQALADINTLQTTNGFSSAKLLAIGDINGDGAFNNADLQSFLTQLQSGSGAGSSAIGPGNVTETAVVSATRVQPNDDVIAPAESQSVFTINTSQIKSSGTPSRSIQKTPRFITPPHWQAIQNRAAEFTPPDDANALPHGLRLRAGQILRTDITGSADEFFASLGGNGTGA